MQTEGHGGAELGSCMSGNDGFDLVGQLLNGVDVMQSCNDKSAFTIDVQMEWEFVLQSRDVMHNCFFTVELLQSLPDQWSGSARITYAKY
jgi:hypothetical protein